jgi:hypothetical protein
MTIPLPDFERSVLHMEATPPPYNPGASAGKGFIYTAEGFGELDFALSGIVVTTEHPLCTMPVGVGILDAYAGVVKEYKIAELETEYIRQGARVTEQLDSVVGIAPLRTLFISDAFGGEVPGGLTIYGIDVNTNLTEALYVGIASRMNVKDDFIFRTWTKVKYPGVLARPIVSGREFKLLLYTQGGGQFTIKGITVWAKLTDRRGFNTSPSQGKAEASSDN